MVLPNRANPGAFNSLAGSRQNCSLNACIRHDGHLSSDSALQLLIFVVHFSRHFCASHDIPERATTDYVLFAMIALFALHMAGVVTGFVDDNLWGKNGVPPAIRIGAAIMMLTMAIEARRRMPVVIVIFAAIGYYFGGGIGDFTWGLENNGLYLITAVSVLTLLISLEPLARGVVHKTSVEAKALDASRHGGVPFYDWFLFVLIGISSLYVAVTYEGLGTILFELNFRIGDPHFIDVMMGTSLVLIVIEAARRTSGISLPIITNLFVMYALFGIYFQYPLVNPAPVGRH